MHGGHPHGSHSHSGMSAGAPTSAVIAATTASPGSRGQSEEGSCVRAWSGRPWCCGCGLLRYLVVVLVLLGNTLETILRSTLSVSIVAMTNTTSSKHSTNEDYACPAALNATADAQSTTGGGEFHWSGQQQAVVLGIIFWSYIITKAIGGRIADVVGARETMGLSVGFGGVLSLLTPLAAELHPYALAFLRLLLGLLLGPVFPAAYSIAGRWAAPGEAATMIALGSSGIALGFTVSLGCTGPFIKAFGWRWVFWGSGILALVWLPVWMVFVRNSPRQHPGISQREFQLLSGNPSQPRRRVPWGRLLRTRLIYLLFLVQFLSSWVQVFIATDAPIFLTEQVGLSLRMSGMACLVAAGSTWFASIFCGWLSDFLTRRGRLRVVTTRRVMQGTGVVLVVGSSLGCVVAGCEELAVSGMLVVMTLGMSLGFVTNSFTPLDIAPNYAGTIAGLVGISDLAGFVGPLVFSYISPMKHGWDIVILMNGGIFLFSGVLYIIFVTDEEVEWNQYQEIDDVRGKEKPSDVTNGNVIH